MWCGHRRAQRARVQRNLSREDMAPRYSYELRELSVQENQISIRQPQKPSSLLLVFMLITGIAKAEDKYR